MPDLKAMSEEIERAVLFSLHANCPTATREALGLELREVADALVGGARNDPSILINRTIGLGTKTPATAEAIAEVAQVYKEIGAQNYFVHLFADDASDAVKQAIADNGLIPARGWMKFQRDNSPSPQANTSLSVRRIGPEDAEPFGRIVASAFGMTEASAPMLAALANDPNWHLFLSYDGLEPAGAGGLYVMGEAAFTDWGATDPVYRRRGSQGAIMQARITAAIDAGCKYLFTETGVAVEGEPQHSYGNIERYGFQPLCLRQNFKPGV